MKKPFSSFFSTNPNGTKFKWDSFRAELRTGLSPAGSVYKMYKADWL